MGLRLKITLLILFSGLSLATSIWLWSGILKESGLISFSSTFPRTGDRSKTEASACENCSTSTITNSNLAYEQSELIKYQTEANYGQNLALAAGRVLSLAWGTCMNKAIIAMSDSQAKAYKENAYSLSQWKSLNQANACTLDKKKVSTPKYYFGSVYEVKNNEIDLLGKNKKARIDCADFVAISLTIAGARTEKDKDTAGASTEFYKKYATNESAGCFSDVKFSQLRSKYGATLLPGDIIATQKGTWRHTVMIDYVYDLKDPFGITSNITSAKDCTISNIDSDQFNFSIIHAGSEPERVAPSRLTAAYYCKISGNFCRRLKDLAVNACKAQFTTDPYEELSAKDSVTSLIRHDPTRDGCTAKNPVVLKNADKCLDNNGGCPWQYKPN